MIRYQRFLKIFLILIFFSTPIFAEQKFIVQNICFHGLHRISTITTLMNFPIRLGDSVSIEDINNSIRALFSTKNFENVQILRNANTFIVQLKERPIITFIKILDNNIINKKTLISFFYELGIHPGQIFDRTKFYSIKQKIQNYYYSLGYYHASIKIMVLSLQHHDVGIIISFKEGKPAKIDNLKILGHKAFNYRELSQNFILHDRKSLLALNNNIFANNGHQYQKILLFQDLEKLRQFYLSHGYANFKLFSTQVNFTPNKEKIFITINLYEGLRYKLKKVIFNGNFIITPKERKKLSFIKDEEWYNLKKVQLLEKCIRNILQNSGYIWPSIHINEIINKDNTINIIVNINKGQRYYVHRIYFRGNHLTQDAVLRRQISQIEGKWFNEDLIEKGKNRLYNTGFFNAVSINVERVPKISNGVDLIYQLKEPEYKGNIKVGLGWDGEKHLTYNIKILHSNWLGTAYTMAFGMNKSNESSHSDITIINPHFTLKDLSISKSIFFNNLYNFDISKYKHKNYGWNDDIAMPINQHNFINIGIGYANNDLSNIQPKINVWHYLRYKGLSPDLLSKIKYTESNFHFKTGWTYNSLNQQLFPTYGIQNKILSTIYIPFPISVLNFIKSYYQITLDSREYINLPIINNHNSWTFLSHGHIGYTSTFLKNNPPFFDHFSAGGLNYLRGFSINTIGTRAIYYNSSNYLCKNKNQPICLSTDGIGGNLMTVASIEMLAPIINPILYHNSLGSMRASIFVDMGTVILINSHWKNPFKKQDYVIINNDINLNNIRISTGINLRWMSPWGPVIAVYSKPLKKDHLDKGESFQFSFGTNW
ncbi:MAG: outer membrane protein assembly factor BamA [Candidatus Dasytiphilus stammeri]